MKDDFNQLVKEIKHIEKNIKKYEAQNESLPKGTIFVRKIHKKSFAYRNRRIDGKVISEYLGPLGREYVDEEVSLSKRYKKNMKMIRELKKILDQMCKRINKKNKRQTEALDFAININAVDGVRPDEDSIAIIKLYEKGVLDFETTENILMRLSHAKG